MQGTRLPGTSQTLTRGDHSSDPPVATPRTQNDAPVGILAACQQVDPLRLLRSHCAGLDKYKLAPPSPDKVMMGQQCRQ